MSIKLKFRDFDHEEEKMRFFDMDSYDRQEHDSYGNIMLFSQYKDKNGSELYENDLLRVKYLLAEDEGWYVDSIYKVELDLFYGMRLSFVRLFDNSDSADLKCQYPPSQTLSVQYRLLTNDYVNNLYDRLAVAESWNEHHNSFRRWKQNHYSNDIERIGNIHENPELLS